jgi:CHASE2 domain-containing sensor protein
VPETGSQQLNGPFPGLAPFSELYSDYFFGRSSEARTIADNLLARRISVLHGPSGAGKSSLLRVGVLATVKTRSRWPCRAAICSSWADGAVTSLSESIAEAIDVPSDHDLGSLLSEAVHRSEGRFLLILDQFEQLLAREGLPEEALVALLADNNPGINLLISLRDDAVADLDAFEGEVPGLFDNMIRLQRLDLRRGREAVVEPVAMWNSIRDAEVEIEPELIDTILHDEIIRDGDEIQAPYMQLVMARLWSERETAVPKADALRLADLTRLGGVKGILATHVDLALSGYPRSDRDRIGAMLAGLTTPSGARVPLTKMDLARYGGTSPTETSRIVDGLVGTAGRLLEPAGEQHYQLTHDALAKPIQDWRQRLAERDARRRELRRLFAVMAFVAALLVTALLTGALRPLELASIDVRFALRGPQPAPSDLVLVEIDEASLHHLKTEWPIPRRLDGEAMDYIGNAHPKAIAYDVDFSGKSSEDALVAESVFGDAGHVVLASEAISPMGKVNVLGGTALLSHIGARAGYSQFPFETGGVTRHPLYARDGLKSFAVATDEAATGKPLSSKGVQSAWIDFFGPAGTFKSIPFWEVIERRVPESVFHNKVVVVGLTTLARDRHAVWGPNHHDMSGAELQANAIETIKRGLPLRSAPTWVGMLLTILFVMLPLLPRRLPGRRARSFRSHRIALIMLTGVLALTYTGVAILAFQAGLVLPLAAPLSALLLAAFALALIAATRRA